MRKYVEIPLEVMERLVEGKCVEGSLKESPQRYKFYNSVRKDLGRRLVNVVMQRELNAAMQALEIEEILDNV